MNREALKKVLNRTQDGGEVQAIPPTPGHPKPSWRTSHPRIRLWALLDTWSTMDEAAWTQEAVDRLKDEILDLFKAYPVEADTWFQEWRVANPGRRLA